MARAVPPGSPSSPRSAIPLLQRFYGDKVISRWLLILMGQPVAQPRSCLLPFAIFTSSDVRILEGLTCLMHAPAPARAEPLCPSPSEGNGKIPRECWGLARIRGFTASLGSLCSWGRENTQLMGARPKPPGSSSDAS